MKIVVISPEGTEGRESDVVTALFAAGLERYHLRKPAWSREELESWIRLLPRQMRTKLVLHQHHDLVTTLQLGGRHWRDEKQPDKPEAVSAAHSPVSSGSSHPIASTNLNSRSCHDLATLRASLGRYDSVFFGPVFPSLSKPGYGPRPAISFDQLALLLAHRSEAERRTSVLALGGVTPETAPRALALGFDGVAVLGAIWQAVDPLLSWAEMQSSLLSHVA